PSMKKPYKREPKQDSQISIRKLTGQKAMRSLPCSTAQQAREHAVSLRSAAASLEPSSARNTHAAKAPHESIGCDRDEPVSYYELAPDG
ncbi:MAG: hypothetical protein ACWGQW_14565, partial [bacterium]